MNTIAVGTQFDALAETARADAAARGEPDWLAAPRRAAFERLKHEGFPTRRVEDWKYTDIRPLVQTTFALPRRTPPPDVGNLLPRRLEDEFELIFIDGVFSRQHSRFDPTPGLSVVPLEDGIKNGCAKRIRERLANALPGDGEPFVCLNRALSGCGVFICVPPNTVMQKRIHVLFLTTGTQSSIVVSPRVIIDINAGSEARVVQSHIGHPGAGSFTNVVTDLHIGENARASFTKVQAEAPEAFHCSYVRCGVAANASAMLCDFSQGARLARNDLIVALDGEGADVQLNGLYAVRDRQHVDHHTTVDHRVPHGASRQIYKGILNGNARAVFNGKIVVRPGASRTDGYQLNQNLLLSRSAAINTKPQLEIANDDVKCSHGATIGQIDEDQRFYLESRGIAPALAVEILSRGFVEDVLYLIRDRSLQESLRSLLDGYFDR